jgi:4-hydroxy-tetrahydrodipicolinate reductase
MDHPQQIEPEQVGVQTGDYVIIKGTPDVNMVNSPEIEGGKGTIAMCANMIPQVINAEPGLHTMLTLPVPRAILGDMRDRIDPAKKLVK